MCEIDWSALGQWAGVFVTGFFSFLIWKIEKFRVDDDMRSKVYELATKKFRLSNGLGKNDALIAIQLAKRHKKQKNDILTAYRDFQEATPSRVSIGAFLTQLAAEDEMGKWPTPAEWFEQSGE